MLRAPYSHPDDRAQIYALLRKFAWIFNRFPRRTPKVIPRSVEGPLSLMFRELLEGSLPPPDARPFLPSKAEHYFQNKDIFLFAPPYPSRFVLTELYSLFCNSISLLCDFLEARTGFAPDRLVDFYLKRNTLYQAQEEAPFSLAGGGKLSKRLYRQMPKVTLYYSVKCPHCVTFYPTWKKLKEALQTGGVKVEEWEATKHPQKLQEKGILGVPTIMVRRKGKEEEYEGPMSSADILRFVSGGAQFKETDPVVATLYHSEGCHFCQEFYPVWKQVKKPLEELGFKVEEYEASEVPGLPEQKGVEGVPTLRFSRGSKETEYQGPREKKALLEQAKAFAAQKGGGSSWYKYQKYKLKYGQK